MRKLLQLGLLIIFMVLLASVTGATISWGSDVESFLPLWSIDYSIGSFNLYGGVTGGYDQYSDHYFIFDGVDDYVSLDSRYGLEDDETWSLCLDYYVENNSNDVTIFGLREGFGVTFTNESYLRFAWLSQSSDWADPVFLLSTNDEWHTACATFDSGTAYLYNDGMKSVATSDSDTTIYDTTFYPTLARGNLVNYYDIFAGRQRNIVIYNKTLSDSEVLNISNGHAVALSDVVFRSDFDQQTDFSNNLNDASGFNGVAFDSGEQGYIFDGGDDYLALPEDVDYLTGPMTICSWIKTRSLSSTQTIFENPNLFLRINSAGDIETEVWENDDGTGNYRDDTFDTNLNVSQEYFVCAVKSASGYASGISTVYVNGINYPFSSTMTGSSSSIYFDSRIGVMYRTNDDDYFDYFNGVISDIKIFNKALLSSEISDIYLMGRNYDPFFVGVPEISSINCSSSEDIVEPYTTGDTTPTFRFETNINSYCRIGNLNESYSFMGSNRTCATTGAMDHVCTLSLEDELSTAEDYVYIVCINLMATKETSVALQMDITNLEQNATLAILRGVSDSSIGLDAKTFLGQQVYLRNIEDDHFLGSVDVVAVYGNQRWLLNYVLPNESKIGLFNMSPVIYSLDVQGGSFTELKNSVRDLIDGTKN